MTKCMRRILSLVLALAVCAGQIVLPAMAEGTGTPENPKVTVTVTVEKDGSVTTDTDSTWETVSEETEPVSITVSGNTTVEMESSTTTTVKGSEQIQENVSVNGNTVTVEGSLEGQETTDTETVTTTTTTKEDVLVAEKDITDAPVTETTPTTYDPVEGPSEEGWNSGKIESGEYPAKEDVPMETGPLSDPKTLESTKETVGVEAPDEDVVLNLTPGNTDSKTIVVTEKDVLSEKYLNNDAYTIEEIKEGDKVVGWKVTKVNDPETSPKPVETTPVVDPDTGKTPEWKQDGEVRTSYVDPGTYTETDGYVRVDENTTRRIEKICNAETGEFEGYRIITVTEETTDNADDPVVMESDRETITVTDLQKPEESITINDLGQTVTITVKELEEDGVLVGYQTITVITDQAGNNVSTEKQNIYGKAAEKDSFTLPAKPEGGVTQNEQGQTVTTTVEDLIEDGVHVGYQVTSVTTNDDGDVIFTETRRIYGTTTQKGTVTTTDPETEETVTTTKVTSTKVEEVYTTESVRDMILKQQYTEIYQTTIDTETDVYQLVNGADGNLYFLYKGQMYAVQEVKDDSGLVHGEVRNNQDVASGSTVSMTGYKDDKYDLRVNGEWIIGNGTHISAGYTGEEFTNNENGTTADGVWTRVGNGLFTDFVVKPNNGDGSSVWQFKIQDGNQVRYVYCVEMGTAAASGAVYSKDTYDGTKDESKVNPWSGATGTIAQLRSVALNGFWGTESGLGSLQAVKDLMARNGVDEVYIKNLSVGMAVAATQAAIWEFSADASKYPNGVFSGNFVTWDDEGENGAVSDLDQKTIKALYNLLMDLAKDPDEGTAEAIDAEDITKAAITLSSKLLNEDGSAQTDDKGNELYSGALAFKLDVSTSSLNGDLVLEITDATGRVIAKRRLAGDDSHGLFKGLNFGNTIQPDENGVYTIENVELAEGVIITLNLKGVQHLDDGIFIYANDTQQDFIGLSQLERNVNLKVDLIFTVDDPKMENVYTKTRQTREDTKTYNKEDTRTDTLVFTQTQTSGTVQTETSHNVKVYGTVTAVETKTETTKESREWNTSWKYTSTSGDEDGTEGTERSKAAKTGDISGLWAAISLLSIGGAALLSKKREEG